MSFDPETRALSAREIGLVLMVAVVLVLDGLDLQLAAFTAPKIMAEWAISKTSFASVLAGAMVGMAVGTFVGGWASDRLGRRTTLLGAVIIFGIATVACGLASGPVQLMTFRFLGGIGFGAAFPAGTALISESLPKAAAPKMIGLIILGIPLGGMIGAAATSYILPLFGWRACFFSGGALAGTLALVLFFLLPESEVFRAKVGIDHPQSDDRPIGLLAPDYRRTSAGIWLGFLANSFATYCFINWIPVLLTDAGMPLEKALRGSFIYNLAQMAGSAVVGWIAVRIGLPRTMRVLVGITLAGLIVMASGYALGFTPAALALALYSGLAIVGFGIGALQAAFYIFSANSYEAHLRGRGVGTGATFGRFGGIASTYAAGLALSAGSGIAFLSLVATMMILILIAIRIAQSQRRSDQLSS